MRLCALLSILLAAGCAKKVACGGGTCAGGSECDTRFSPPACVDAACVQSQVQSDLSLFSRLGADLQANPNRYTTSLTAAAGRLSPRHYAFAVEALMAYDGMRDGGSPPYELLEDPRLAEIVAAAPDLPLVGALGTQLSTPQANGCVSAPSGAATVQALDSWTCATSCEEEAHKAARDRSITAESIRQFEEQLPQAIAVYAGTVDKPASWTHALPGDAIAFQRALEEAIIAVHEVNLQDVPGSVANPDLQTHVRKIGDILGGAAGTAAINFSGDTAAGDYKLSFKAVPGLYQATFTLVFGERRDPNVLNSCRERKKALGCQPCPLYLACDVGGCPGQTRCDHGFLISCTPASDCSGVTTGSGSGTGGTGGSTPLYTITTSVTGTGAAWGGIARDNPGPDYPFGASVTLTATTSSAQATFEGWSGACSGTKQQCVVNMDGNKLVGANFTLNAPPASDGGVCGVQQVAGGDAPDTRDIQMGRSSGTFSFSYDTYTQQDDIRVSYQGQTLFDTGCVGASGSPSLSYGGASSAITVSVSPNCAGGSGTAWDYTVGCPR